MNSIKRFEAAVGIFLVIAIVTMMVVACGGKSEEPAEPDQTATEAEDVANETENEAVDEDTADIEESAENATEDTEMTEEQKAAEAERQAMLKYNEEILGLDMEEFDSAANLGVPEEKLQELYSAIENAVKVEYLEKYNIEVSNFEWPPSTSSGKGEPKPWAYLNGKMEQKMLNFNEEPEMDLSIYALTDSQTTELMDCIYRQIVNWVQTNGYYSLSFSTNWQEIVLQHVVIE